MSSTYQPEAWQTLYTMLGGSLAAIAGLLFIAMSLHIEGIMRTQILRMRAAVSMIALVLLFTVAGTVLVPQPVAALGIEISVLSILGLMLPASIAARLIRMHRAAAIPKRATVSAAIYLVGIAGGVLLAMGLTAGMYLITAHFFVNIGFAFFNSWSILTGIDEREELGRNV